MKRGQVFVRGLSRDGENATIDVLSLDDESFRAFVIDRLLAHGLVVGIKDEHVEGEQIVLQERRVHKK